MGKMFFNILATFAEFESDLIRMRTREGMAVARAKGKLRGKKPKLSDRQAHDLRRIHRIRARLEGRPQRMSHSWATAYSSTTTIVASNTASPPATCLSSNSRIAPR